MIVGEVAANGMPEKMVGDPQEVRGWGGRGGVQFRYR